MIKPSVFVGYGFIKCGIEAGLFRILSIVLKYEGCWCVIGDLAYDGDRYKHSVFTD
jgi:hypothetical protein